MGKLRVIRSTIILSGLLLLPQQAQAVTQTHDAVQNANVIREVNNGTKTVQQLEKQLEEAQKRYKKLQEVSKHAQDVSDTMGKLGTITLPTLSLKNLQSDLISNAMCLLPTGPSYGINYKEWRLGNLCNLSNKYREKFFVTTDAEEDLDGYQLNEKRQEVSLRRDRLLMDSTTRGAAMADTKTQQAEKLSKTAKNLQDKLDAAQTVQERTAIAAQAQVTNAVALTALLEVNTMMLKQQSAYFMKTASPPDDMGDEEEKEGTQ